MNISEIHLTGLLYSALFTSAACLLLLGCRRLSPALTGTASRVAISLSLAAAAIPWLTSNWRQEEPVPVQAVTAIPELPSPSAAGQRPDSWNLQASLTANSQDTNSNQPVLSPVTSLIRISPTLTVSLALVWLTGALAMLGRWGVALAARSHMAAVARPVTEAGWLGEFQRFPAASRIRLLQSPRCAMPCAWGTLRPVILLPEAAIHWPEEHRRMVLAHECSHLLHRDPLWMVLGNWFLAVQWFNPLAWWIESRHRAASERIADDAVVTSQSDAPGYASLLLDCTRRGMTRSVPALCQMATSSAVSHRITRILDSSANRRPAGIFSRVVMSAAGALIIGGILTFAPQIAFGDEPSPATPTDSPATPENTSNTDSAPNSPAPELVPSAPEPAEKPVKDFAWNVEKIGELDYLPHEDLVKYYRFSTATREENVLTFASEHVSMLWIANSPEISVSSTKIILAHPIVERNERLWISRMDLSLILNPILRPSQFYSEQPLSTIILDPGHGGADSGYADAKGKESDWNLRFAKVLKNKLEINGWTVIMTRTGDNFVSRAERIAIANQHPDAIFVSIHANGTSPGSSVSGMETFFPGMGADDSNSEDEKAETIRRARSVSLAVALHTLTLYKGKSRDLGVKGRGLDVLTGIRIPGVLIEAGFLSHEAEARRLRTPAAVDALAKSLHAGLRNYRLAIHGGR